MIENYALSPIKGYGFGNLIAAVRFVPGATPTIQESWGVKTVARNGGAGLYRITLADRPPGLVALAGYSENDTTLFHFVRVEAFSAANGTVDISHKSVAFASIASGPTASDTVDDLTVFVYSRGQ